MTTPLVLRSGGDEFGADSAGFDMNPEGDVVVFLHGFPDDRSTFRHQLHALAEAGHRAIAVSLRGYEPSSIPADGDVSLVRLADDVIAWADDLGVDRVHVVGHDWGAAIGGVTAARHPDRLRSLTMIAVPHVARIPIGVRRVPVQLVKSWYMTFFQLRGVAEWAVSARDWWLVRRLWRRWSPGYDLADVDWLRLRERFELPGVKSSMLAYYRQNATPPVLLGLRRTEAMKLTTIDVATLAITGADDGCIDTRMFDHTMSADDFSSGVRVERIADAGHFVHLERPDVVNTLLLDWIADH